METKNIIGCQVSAGRDFQAAGMPFDAAVVGACHYTFVQAHRVRNAEWTRMSPPDSGRR